MADTTKSVQKKDLVVTRVFDASVGQVWKAWTDPEQVMCWWGPEGFTSPFARIDFREGGTSLVAMRSPEGQDIYTMWTYQKIVPMQRMEFILNFADKDGRKVDPVTIGLPADLQKEVRHVVTLKAVGNNRTEMTVTEQGYTSDPVLELSRAGLEQSLDKIAESLKQ